MAKAAKLKLPADFLGTVAALLNTKPPEKPKRKKVAPKKARKAKK